ncbi:MAG TPA: cbb3-type cytochrome oxidase assembly protein CcoS [Fibrobacteria bacterium]|nr:cbb3-type cytochrome oxidase assembly protein CcoS [Fibrobacteria bacterium]
MSVLILLIAVSLALSAAFVAACIVSIRSGQFDDLDSPRWRVFFADATESLPLTPGLHPDTPARIPSHDPH